MAAKSGLQFPIVLKTHEEILAPGTLYYEVAANGIFQVRDAPTHRAVTRAERHVPGLFPSEESLELHFPRLPRTQVEDVLAFFFEVYSRFRGEAIVLLFYDSSEQHFEIRVPPQTIGAYTDAYGRKWVDNHLDYGDVARPAGCIRLGTIHSHGDLAAYASHTDCKDERYGDGLHIVFGHLGAARISSSAAFVANGRRFPLDPQDVLEAAEIPARPAPRPWLDAVEYVESAAATRSYAEPLPLDRPTPAYSGYPAYSSYSNYSASSAPRMPGVSEDECED